jgi:hypothetical protein
MIINSYRLTTTGGEEPPPPDPTLGGLIPVTIPFVIGGSTTPVLETEALTTIMTEADEPLNLE